VLPEEDRFFWTKAQFEDMLAYFMGGHVAEEIIFSEISTGASNDIERATGLARRMVTEYGMSKTLGPLAFGRKEELVFLGREINEQRNYSDEIAFQIDQEIRQLIDQAYATARQVLMDNADKLEAIALLLMERETIEADELEALFDSPRPQPTLSGPPSSLRPAAADRSDRREPEPTPRLLPQPASG
jgi:cell division protease FtsH